MREQDNITAILPPPGPDSHAPAAPAGQASASAGSAAPAQHARRGSWHAGPAVEPMHIDLSRGAGSGIGTRRTLHQGHSNVGVEESSHDSSGATTEGGPRITLQQAAEIWAETPSGASRLRRQQWPPDAGSSHPNEPESVAAASIETTAGDLSSGETSSGMCVPVCIEPKTQQVVLQVHRAQVSALDVVQLLPSTGLPCGAAGSDVSLGFTPRRTGGAAKDSAFTQAAGASRIPEPSITDFDPALDGSRQAAGHAAASRLPLFRAHPVLRTLAAAERAMQQTPGAGASEHVTRVSRLTNPEPSPLTRQQLLCDGQQQLALMRDWSKMAGHCCRLQAGQRLRHHTRRHPPDRAFSQTRRCLRRLRRLRHRVRRARRCPVLWHSRA
jgi:hypothetical protein